MNGNSDGSGSSTSQASRSQVSSGPSFFNPFAVELPEKLDFRDPHDWKRWSTRWERYRIISGLHQRDAATQVNTFLYAMGREAEDVLTSLHLSEAELNDYGVVKSKFELHFIPRVNIIFERAKFNMRKQEPDETVEAFITALHSLADSCDYGLLREELIRDRIVVGLQDRKLSEKLQLDAKLTLQSATATARSFETVKRQQAELHSDKTESREIEELRNRYPKDNGKKKDTRARGTSNRQGDSNSAAWKCRWCGSSCKHEKTQCAARGKKCNACKKVGHFESVCFSKLASGSHRSQVHKPGLNEVFLGALVHADSGDPWYIKAKVNNQEITFKVDTGADVTAIPHTEYKVGEMAKLEPAGEDLRGAGDSPLTTLGKFQATITWNGRTSKETVYVSERLRHPLLGLPAIQALQVLPSLNEIKADNHLEHDRVLTKYPSLFQGLGKMKVLYTISLHPDAKPFAITYPRRVPIALLPSVELELKRMQEMDVIEKVEHATVWCSPMVVAKKQDGALRICVDYTQLNQQIVRERIIMPTVEENLAKLAGATVFSKLDANAGYWQAPLAPESRELTTFITPVGRFQFKRLPFGIATAPEFFQREMLRILEGIQGQVCHMNDINFWTKQA